LDIKKIVVIGPESTGKSTLSEALAIALHTVWVPEYARFFLEHLNEPYSEDDLGTIARGQLASEDKLTANANKVLICDTDLHVIKVWGEHKYGRCDPFVQQAILDRKYDLYLLTGIDMPWLPDPLREHPDEAMRQYFYSIYRDIMVSSGVPWFAINGDEGQRLAASLQAIESMGWGV
jgi:NadR type nicotinamide-nucleotide adenylyltransferase